MKRIYLLLVMLLASATSLFAQAPSAYGVRVVNQTNCPVYFSIIGDEICKCGRNYQTGVISLAAGGTVTYNNTTFLPPGGGSTYPPTVPKGISGAIIYNGPATCPGLLSSVVGQPTPNCAFPLNYAYLAIAAQCQRCADVRVRWVPANNCQELAQLIFY